MEYEHATRYWRRHHDGRVECTLCPHHCTLRDGKRGICYLRMAKGGEIVLTHWGQTSGFCIDPIEKKPLNHFLPGSSVLSFGTQGCNLTCRYCQNWQISKSRDEATQQTRAQPEQIAELAQRHGCQSVAFTYNDPVISFEFTLAVAEACHARGIKTVAVSAGYIEPAAGRELFAAMDAANIDLKGFSNEFYHHLCGGTLAPVLDTLRLIRRETPCWLEITTLIIPGHNDDETSLTALPRWIAEELGPDVPLHLSAFHPDFHLMEVPATPPSTLLKAREKALAAGLHHVYLGNVRDQAGQSSWCPGCGALLIGRDGYQVVQWRLRDGCCPDCGRPLAGVVTQPLGDWGNRRQRITLE